LYEPCHGSAPDITGKNIANPLATILSLAMMMRYTFARADIAQRIESAVRKTLPARFAPLRTLPRREWRKLVRKRWAMPCCDVVKLI